MRVAARGLDAVAIAVPGGAAHRDAVDADVVVLDVGIARALVAGVLDARVEPVDA